MTVLSLLSQITEVDEQTTWWSVSWKMCEEIIIEYSIRDVPDMFNIPFSNVLDLQDYMYFSVFYELQGWAVSLFS